MPGIEIMLPIALGIAGIFLILFLWSARNGDMEDLEARKFRPLMDSSNDVDRSVLPQGKKERDES
ncbi:MAG: cbb3-type cytochrome oxidase assembly protein CcoS [Spirochaetia bacterium]|nr:cbb3-type cytochrome oxidase assembly protein CcoS [Spirochaetia bacterium]